MDFSIGRGGSEFLAKRWEPRGFSRVASAFSSYDGDLSLPLGLALGSPIFPSGCEGKLGVALESLHRARPRNRGLLARGTNTRLRLEFLRDQTNRHRNSFQTKEQDKASEKIFDETDVIYLVKSSKQQS